MPGSSSLPSARETTLATCLADLGSHRLQLPTWQLNIRRLTRLTTTSYLKTSALIDKPWPHVYPGRPGSHRGLGLWLPHTWQLQQ